MTAKFTSSGYGPEPHDTRPPRSPSNHVQRLTRSHLGSFSAGALLSAFVALALSLVPLCRSLLAAAPGSAPGAAPSATAAVPLDSVLAYGIAIGSPDAPITITEFGDFECPACSAFATGPQQNVLRSRIRDGNVRFVWVDFPLSEIHPSARLAALAARCAHDQRRFWDYHERLFAHQADWTRMEDPREAFVSYAAVLGLDTADFDACLRDQPHTRSIDDARAFALRSGAAATPWLLLQGRHVDHSADPLRDAIAAAAAELENP